MAEGVSATFDGRMSDWNNDDLLLTKAHRDMVEAEYPGALAVFDFVALREKFAKIDRSANAGRRRRERVGMVAVLVAGAGAGLAAAYPLFKQLEIALAKEFFVGAAFLSLLGFILTLSLIWGDRNKSEWLQLRLRTERMRQFYFQFMLSDPALAARALKGGSDLTEWQARREAAYRFLEAWLKRPMGTELHAVISDTNQRQIWLIDNWRRAAISDGTDLTTYFEILKRQRVGVQLSYLREKLAPGIGSPLTRLHIVRVLSWVFAGLTLAMTMVSATLLFFGVEPRAEEATLDILTSVIALFGVLSIVVRVIGDGLNLQGDCDRYAWYRGAVEEVDSRFTNEDPNSRLNALRDLEAASYRELQEFLESHNKSVFNFS